MYKSANRQFISVNLPIHIPIHSLSTQTQFVSPENLSDDFCILYSERRVSTILNKENMVNFVV